MGVYYYIINRTLRQKTKHHYGKWGEFDFQSAVEGLLGSKQRWSPEHDIWAIGDDQSDAVKYYPRKYLPDKEIKIGLYDYEEIEF